ncbi:uncharacterized protein LOC112502690 [Cynara cardunculus var. scolymus]|uniref:uncharacterized protein LOC112502690 n=1 Tax=Cynara cardunculus var. scolymus TaxID=59895 RepID=UPI000D6234EB|nr:uncharacterized protein LOC112502690 [Cynara cardunculus var. scolymus]
MAFVSFLGRVLFVSVFVLSAWQEFNEFGNDGGSAAKTLVPKFSVFSKHVTAHTGFQVPEFEIKILVAGAIALKGIGSLLFIFGSTIGAFLLILHQLIATPILYDFYNYDVEKKEFSQLFIKFTQNLALLGGLMFFIGMKTSMPRRPLNKKKASKSKTV